MNKKKKKYILNGKIIFFLVIVFVIICISLFVINIKLSEIENEKLDKWCDIFCSDAGALTYKYSPSSKYCYCYVSEDQVYVYDMTKADFSNLTVGP